MNGNDYGAELSYGNDYGDELSYSDSSIAGNTYGHELPDSSIKGNVNGEEFSHSDSSYYYNNNDYNEDFSDKLIQNSEPDIQPSSNGTKVIYFHPPKNQTKIDSTQEASTTSSYDIGDNIHDNSDAKTFSYSSPAITTIATETFPNISDTNPSFNDTEQVLYNNENGKEEVDGPGTYLKTDIDNITEDL